MLLEQNLLHSISLGKLKAEDLLLKRVRGYRDTNLSKDHSLQQSRGNVSLLGTKQI